MRERMEMVARSIVLDVDIWRVGRPRRDEDGGAKSYGLFVVTWDRDDDEWPGCSADGWLFRVPRFLNFRFGFTLFARVSTLLATGPCPPKRIQLTCTHTLLVAMLRGITHRHPVTQPERELRRAQPSPFRFHVPRSKNLPMKEVR